MEPFIEAVVADLTRLAYKDVPEYMTLLRTARLLAGADDEDEEVDPSEFSYPLCTYMLTLVHEHGLSYTTLSEALRSLSVGTDRYREIFLTTIAVKYECQRCYWKEFDEPESVVVLDHPCLEWFAPQAREICSRKKDRDDGICGGTITCQRQFPDGIAKILWIEGPMSNLELQDYDDRGFLTGCLETGLYWRCVGGVL